MHISVLRCMKGISESGTFLCVQRLCRHGELGGDAPAARLVSRCLLTRFLFTHVLFSRPCWAGLTPRHKGMIADPQREEICEETNYGAKR